MLNKQEKYAILRVFRAYCILGPIPVRVDHQKWELLPVTSQKEIWFSRCLFFLSILHLLYKDSSLAMVYFFETGVPIHELTFHAVWSISASVFLFWYYFLYFRHADLFGTYFKMTLTGNLGGKDGPYDESKRSWPRRLKERTPQDWLVMFLPYMTTSGSGCALLLFMCYPSMKVLLYSALPETYKTPIVFGILLLEELRLLLIAYAAATPAWVLQVMAFDLVNNKVQQVISSMQRTANAERLNNAYKTLRHAQLYMGIVNEVNSYLIYLWKTLCMFLGIASGYAAIMHFSDFPIFGVLFYAIFIYSGSIYIVSYDKAFHVPDVFRDAAQAAMLRAHTTKNLELATIFKLQIKSIPRIGIKVGGFHTMERESSPAFLDFVVGNIVSLLAAN